MRLRAVNLLRAEVWAAFALVPAPFAEGPYLQVSSHSNEHQRTRTNDKA